MEKKDCKHSQGRALKDLSAVAFDRMGSLDGSASMLSIFLRAI